MWLWAFVVAAVILFVLRLTYCLLVSDDLRPTIARQSCLTTVAVLGSGGHTSELLILLRHLNQDHYQPLHLLVAETDAHSIAKAIDFQNVGIHRIPRARHVGQSAVSAVLTSIVALVHTLQLINRLQPQLVIGNGPGTCVPVLLAAFLHRVAIFRPCKLVFVESFCRVRSISLSGRLLRPFVDEFYVQWPALKSIVPKAKYIGPLC